jgi:hypothetical protein
MLDQMRMWSRRQWRAAGSAFLFSFLLMGVVGETLPVASIGREVSVEWWNYLTLVLSPLLIGLIAATFVSSERPRGDRFEGAEAVAGTGGTKAGVGIGGALGTVAMACPACSPLAIPLFGAAGVLSFLAPERWLIALLSILLLAVTLVLRLRGARECEIPADGPGGGARGAA